MRVAVSPLRGRSGGLSHVLSAIPYLLTPSVDNDCERPTFTCEPYDIARGENPFIKSDKATQNRLVCNLMLVDQFASYMEGLERACVAFPTYSTSLLPLKLLSWIKWEVMPFGKIIRIETKAKSAAEVVKLVAMPISRVEAILMHDPLTSEIFGRRHPGRETNADPQEEALISLRGWHQGFVPISDFRAPEETRMHKLVQEIVRTGELDRQRFEVYKNDLQQVDSNNLTLTPEKTFSSTHRLRRHVKWSHSSLSLLRHGSMQIYGRNGGTFFRTSESTLQHLPPLTLHGISRPC